MPTFEDAFTEFGLVTIEGNSVSDVMTPDELDAIDGDPGYVAVIENPMGSEKTTQPLESRTEASAVFDSLSTIAGSAPGTKVTVMKEVGTVDGRAVFRPVKATVLRSS